VSLRIANTVVELDPARVSGRAPADERTVSVSEIAPGANDVVDVSFEPVRSIQSVPDRESRDEARANVIATLEAERRAELGAFTHRHTPGHCGFCRRAVAAYR
jgi:hypothetical protein